MFKASNWIRLIGCAFCVFAGLSSHGQLSPIPNGPVASQSTTTIEKELRDIISLWAGAWAAQIPDAYFDFYSDYYIAPEFSTREDWMDDRRRRIEEPDYIRIRLLDLEIIETNEILIGELLAITRFTLIYERPGYSDSTYKELELINRNGEWKISAETNIRVEVGA